uniref:Uncharacterized protein n=1 Tax=Laticauda laticaudata TaxID=8630 RepID=A0A8C5RP00_LATLA
RHCGAAQQDGGQDGDGLPLPAVPPQRLRRAPEPPVQRGAPAAAARCPGPAGREGAGAARPGSGSAGAATDGSPAFPGQVAAARAAARRAEVLPFQAGEHERRVWCPCCAREVPSHLSRGARTVLHGGLLQHLTSLEHGRAVAAFWRKNRADPKLKADYLLSAAEYRRFQESLCEALDAYEEKEDAAIQEVDLGAGAGIQVVQGGQGPGFSSGLLLMSHLSSLQAAAHIRDMEQKRREMVQAILEVCVPKFRVGSIHHRVCNGFCRILPLFPCLLPPFS